MIKKLIEGLEFAREHELTQREIKILIPFLHKTYTVPKLAEELDVNKTTLHHTIQRLKLKHLIVLKDRDEKGINLYEFNVKIL